MWSTVGHAPSLPACNESPRGVPSTLIWAVQIRMSANPVCRANKGATVSQTGGNWRHHGCWKSLTELVRDAWVILRGRHWMGADTQIYQGICEIGTFISDEPFRTCSHIAHWGMETFWKQVLWYMKTFWRKRPAIATGPDPRQGGALLNPLCCSAAQAHQNCLCGSQKG